MINITVNNRFKLRAYEKLAELPRKKLFILSEMKTRKTEITEFRTKVLFHLFSHWNTIWVAWFLYVMAKPHTLAEALHLADFVIQESMTDNLIKYLYIRKKFLWWKYKSTKLLGPYHMLENLTLDEFRCTEKHYIDYHYNKDFEDLQKLACILFRPTDKKGNRIPFDDIWYKKHYKKLCYIPYNELITVFLWYVECRQKITETHPEIYGGGGDSSGENYGLDGLLLDLSGSKFGNLVETQNTPIWTILFEVEKELKRAKKRKTK